MSAMDQNAPKKAKIILPLLGVIEEQTVENLALREVLDLLWKFFPKGVHGRENLGLEPLIDQQRRELAPRVAERFQVFHDRLFVVFGGDHPQLPEGWEEEVRRLIDGLGQGE